MVSWDRLTPGIDFWVHRQQLWYYVWSGGPTLLFDIVYSHLHHVTFGFTEPWNKIIKKKRSLINYFVFVTPYLTCQVLCSSNCLCFLMAIYVLLWLWHLVKMSLGNTWHRDVRMPSWQIQITQHPTPYLRIPVLFSPGLVIFSQLTFSWDVGVVFMPWVFDSSTD